jgi:hypothetical protein
LCPAATVEAQAHTSASTNKAAIQHKTTSDIWEHYKPLGKGMTHILNASILILANINSFIFFYS